MDSFYGGPRGISFQLVKNYSSKSEMVEDFGTSTCPVGYGEYVIIDSSTNENGSVYRRGTASSIDNGAEYICNIIGKQGRHSELNIASYNNINGEPIELSLNDGLVSGKTQKTIKIKQEMVLDDAANTMITQLGLQIPYPVIEFEVKSSSLASNFSINKKETDENNPFYSQYELIAPESLINQKSLQSIQQKIITLNTGTIYDPITESVISNNNYLNKTVLTYTVKQGENIKEYLISTINTLQNISYDTDNNNIVFNYGNETITIPIKTLERLNLNADGSIVAKYSDSDTEVIINEDNYLKWIDNVAYDDENHELVITYNTPNAIDRISFSPEKTFNYVSSIETNNDNNLVIKQWEAGTQSFTTKTISTKNLTGMTINSNGKIIYTYSDNTNAQGGTIKLIDNISYNEETKQIQITYNTGDSDSFPANPKSIKAIRQDGRNMIITYDSGETKTLTNVFQTIQNFNLDNATGELTVNLNGSTISLGTISYINDINYDNATGYLQYSYQNSNTYTNITKIKQIQRVWIDNNDLKVQYNISDEPENLGEVRINQILDVELFLDTTNIPNILNYLKSTYPNGYQNNPNYCVAAGGQNKKIYGYGYYQTTDDNGNSVISATKDWYLIGDYSNGPTAVAAPVSTVSAVQTLPLGGLWFKTEER